MEEALSLASANCKVSLHSIYDLAFNGTFHVHISGARLCFHYMKTLALAYQPKEKPLPMVAVSGVTDPFAIAFISK